MGNPLDMAASMALTGLGQLARGTVELTSAAGGVLATGAMAGAKALMAGEGGFFDESITVRAYTALDTPARAPVGPPRGARPPRRPLTAPRALSPARVPLPRSPSRSSTCSTTWR